MVKNSETVFLIILLRISAALFKDSIS